MLSKEGTVAHTHSTKSIECLVASSVHTNPKYLCTAVVAETSNDIVHCLNIIKLGYAP